MRDKTGKAIAIVGILLAGVAYCFGPQDVEGCEEITLNHSGVLECHVGPYDGPLPVEFMTVDTAQEITL